MRLRALAFAAVLSAGCSQSVAAPAKSELRVCADPNNMPFSNRRGEGFENQIANLVASDMNATVKYTWWAQRRGFIRNTLNAKACDVVVGVPSTFDLTAVTAPYYRSSYVFVTRHDGSVKVSSFDDPALRHLRIGVQLVGDEERTPRRCTLSTNAASPEISKVIWSTEITATRIRRRTSLLQLRKVTLTSRSYGDRRPDTSQGSSPFRSTSFLYRRRWICRSCLSYSTCPWEFDTRTRHSATGSTLCS
jgi:ABC-type amino acid transport/signal transduction systems, periplasmic component/domain